MVRGRARSGGDVARQRHHEDRKATPRPPSASRHREPLAEAPRVGQLPQSSVNPTFIVTCQCVTLLFSIAPRTSLTWNQRRLWSVFDALAMAPLIASSTVSVEEPVISIDL